MPYSKRYAMQEEYANESALMWSDERRITMGLRLSPRLGVCNTRRLQTTSRMARIRCSHRAIRRRDYRANEGDTPLSKCGATRPHHRTTNFQNTDFFAAA